MMMKIDNEFRSLIPSLSSDELRGLASSILAEGCRDPLVVWSGTIIDGHNRYRICQEHGIEFQTIERSFGSREAAKEWIIRNQLSRRNLNAYQYGRLALRLEETVRARAKEQQGTRTDISARLPKSLEPIDTRFELAKVAHVGERTMGKIMKIEKQATPEQRMRLERGEASIDGIYEEIKKPHVAQSTGMNEWYTPSEYIEAARVVLGGIDLDPASSELANSVVKARKIYTIEDDGLVQDWVGRIWLNPPYSSDLVGLFADKLEAEVGSGNVDAAIVLVNNATETRWFSILIGMASAVCFPTGRVRFWSEGDKVGTPLQGQAVVYVGGSLDTFRKEFASFGWIASL